MDSNAILLLGCSLPVIAATLLSWLTIRQGHRIIGIIAAPVLVLLLLLAFTTWIYQSLHDLHLERGYNVQSQGLAFMGYIGSMILLVDAVLALAISVNIAAIYWAHRGR